MRHKTRLVPAFDTCVRAVIAIMLATVATTALAADPPEAKQAATWPFYAFDNGLGRGTLAPDEQATILAEAGYDGIGYTGVENIPAMLKALDARGLKMYSTYVRVELGADLPAVDPGLPLAIQQLKGRRTLLWLHVHGDKSGTTDRDTLDDRAVSIIRRIAKLAAASDLPVALYPHVGFHVATVDDAVRLVKRIDRENVGTSFNLCHFLKQHDERELRGQLEKVLPWLVQVSINGADSGNTQELGWDRLIQTLDRGSFDIGRFLDTVRRLGYDGPIGLQCFAIKGDVRQNMQRSMTAWRESTRQGE